MAYVSKSEVRYRLALDSFKPSDTILDDLIDKAETELKNILGGSLTLANIVKNEKDLVDKILIDNFQSINSVQINNKTLDEFSDIEILVNPDAEKTENSEVQGWNELEGTGDTLSHNSDNSYIYTYSLKISKAAAVNSYWYSDSYAFQEQTYYKASARIFVDANTSEKTYLKLEFLDVDDTVVKTYTSEAVSTQITQPSSASVIACVSASADDDNQSILIYGVCENKTITEAVELNGTGSVNSKNSFTSIISVKKSSSTTGTITLTSNSAVVTNCTLTSSQEERNKWINASVRGSATQDAHSVRVSFYVSSSASSGVAYGDTFQLRKQNWFLMIDGIHFNAKQTGIFIIDYEQAQVSKLVRELLRDLTALFVLINLTGADTAQINYKSLKSAQFQNMGSSQLYKRIYESFLFNINAYNEQHSLDFIMGEIK